MRVNNYGKYKVNLDAMEMILNLHLRQLSQHPQVGENEPSQQIARSSWQPQTPSCQEQQPLLLINKNLDTV